MRTTAVLASAALLAVVAAPALAQQDPFKACGDPAAITLVFLNPDLRPQEDGFVHASGTFFIQFQAIGSQAAEVAEIAFSFGKTIPEPAETCASPAGPVTGVGITDYRTDAVADDGFFVPINTTLVPDGEYWAAITAYNAAGGYLSHFYTKAIVENGAECWPTRAKCQDRVEPWPMILPGDGVQTNSAGGLTVEFAEPVADIILKVNGVHRVPEPWVPPPRDDDAQPRNDNEDCGALGSLPISHVCHRTVWGSGYILNYQPKDGDVIEVYAIDLAGNDATKIVTVGGATQGGSIVLATPELQVTAEATEIEVEAGETAEYRLKLVNVGQGDAEARMTLDAPNTTSTEWGSPTVKVSPGAEQFVALKATPGKDTVPGGYTLVAKATYKSGTDDVTRSLSLLLKVTEFQPVPDSPLRKARANLTQTAADGGGAGGEPKKTPGLEPLVGAGALAAVAVALRDRRRLR